MNNIGFGIFCFGQDYYYRGAYEKIKNILNEGFHCYILTEDPEYFTTKFTPTFTHIFEYQRSFKSYADKMILCKEILKNHDICILIDADAFIKDYSFLHFLKTYQFKYGISYIDTLLNHSAKKEFVKDLVNIETPEWNAYDLFAKKIYPNYGEFKTMWEYFLVINKDGFKKNKFYELYEKLQLAKEFCDVNLNKRVNGAGEGISIQISAELSNTDLQRDIDLYNYLKDKIKSISKAHTPVNEWPDWMR